jgi:hypothetical protein
MTMGIDRLNHTMGWVKSLTAVRNTLDLHLFRKANRFMLNALFSVGAD